MSSTHASLRPVYNLLFIILWAVASVFFLFIVKPHVPMMLAIVGGGLGAMGGLMQHMSFTQATDGFAAASSLLEVRRALKATPWGGRYIWWLYFCKLVLIVIAFALIRGPLLQVVVGYLGGYFALMLIRDLVTFRDTIVLDRFRKSSQPN
jgi:hypothetical protein